MRTALPLVTKRLHVERLEMRTLLAGEPVAGPIGPVDADFAGVDSALANDVSGLPISAAGSAPINEREFGSGTSPGAVALLAEVVTNGGLEFNGFVAPVSASPEATTAVGQMTITNGQNTLGISGFASPTIGSDAGGGGGQIRKSGGNGAQVENTLTGAVEDDAEDESPSQREKQLPIDKAIDELFVP